MRTVIIVQARMGSTRLPGKVMEKVLGKPLLGHLVDRLRKCQSTQEIVVATTSNPLDKQIVDFCKREKIDYFIGSEENVLDRYWHAAIASGADVIVRISGDCPLIDPEIVDQVVELFHQQYPSYAYVSNTLKRTFPRGMDVEVFAFKNLEEAKKYASSPDEIEHVTPYIYRNPDRYSLGSITRYPDSSSYRLTLDTKEDLALIKLIVENLYPRNNNFKLAEILSLLDRHPDWAGINAGVKQKELKSHAGN